MRHTRAALELLAPVVLVVAVALFGTLVSTSTQTYVITTLVNVAIVVALFAFFKFLIQSGRRKLRSFEHVDALRAHCREQVIEVVRTNHVLRD